MRSLVERFVPVADEVGRLQRGDDAECRLFQQIAEHGHYGGREGKTRQGMYAATPSGVFLGSINTRHPHRLAAMLESALERWDEIEPEQRLAGDAERPAPVVRWEDRYPADGLVLRVVSRDGPREEESGLSPRDWRRFAWNLDYAWFTAEEAARFAPDSVDCGWRHEVPSELVRRLARLHLFDNVRGQSGPYDADDVEVAELATIVSGVERDLTHLDFEGTTRTRRRGTWAVNGFADEPEERERGIETRIAGRASWNRKTKRFTSFRLVAVGTRWGATQFNGRRDDQEAAPIGFAFELAEDTPANRVAPAFIWRYGWKRPR